MRRARTTHEQKQAWLRDRYAADSASTTLASKFAEHHYSPAEVAELWGLSPDKVRAVFRREPGVLVFGGDDGRGKRGYAVLRIPQSVLEKVHRRLSNG